jgi:hypothetical protein
MKSIVNLLLMLATLAIATGAHAQRPPVPIVNHENVPVTTSSGKQPTAEQVKQAIINGAVAKKWTVTHTADGQKLHVKLFVNNKHTVVSEIENTDKSYSIRYVSSIDMKFAVVDNVPVIHPYYNRWVTELMNSIRVEFQKL